MADDKKPKSGPAQPPSREEPADGFLLDKETLLDFYRVFWQAKRMLRPCVTRKDCDDKLKEIRERLGEAELAELESREGLWR